MKQTLRPFPATAQNIGAFLDVMLQCGFGIYCCLAGWNKVKARLAEWKIEDEKPVAQAIGLSTPTLAARAAWLLYFKKGLNFRRVRRFNCSLSRAVSSIGRASDS